MQDRSFNKLVQLLETVDPTMNQYPPTAQAMEDHSREAQRMAEAQINEIIKNAERIREMLAKVSHDSDEEIHAWMQSKLTLADISLASVAEAMTNDLKHQQP